MGAWLVAVAASGVLASWARHQWVEAQGLAARCAQEPERWPCGPRQAVIELFLDHKLGHAAMALGALALAGAWHASSTGRAGRLLMAVSGAGACCAVAGLTLYDADRSALGFVLSALAFSRLFYRAAVASERSA